LESKPLSVTDSPLLVIDLHCHSRHSDGQATVSELVARAAALGLGLAITDHNEIRGSIAACQRDGFITVPAIEVGSIDGLDLLLYFYRPEDLEAFYRAHVEPHRMPLMNGRTRRRLTDMLADAGAAPCLICLAHPFGVMWKSIETVLADCPSLPDRVHLVEALNGANPRSANERALAFAHQHNKAICGGSDAHVLAGLGSAVTIADGPSVATFLDALRQGRGWVRGGRMRRDVQWISNVSMARRQVRNWGRAVSRLARKKLRQKWNSLVRPHY
jgi:predicted metal-dependent phosphoesterase TrpH